MGPEYARGGLGVESVAAGRGTCRGGGGAIGPEYARGGMVESVEAGVGAGRGSGAAMGPYAKRGILVERLPERITVGRDGGGSMGGIGVESRGGGVIGWGKFIYQLFRGSAGMGGGFGSM